jgi:hypothetical protein
MLKKIIRSITPPILPYSFAVLKKKFGKERLFDGDDTLFKALVSSASVYGEYGVGQSTRFVLDFYDCRVLCVDTSAEWIERILPANSRERQRLLVKHVDLGTLGPWGRPLSYKQSPLFQEYTDWIWSHEEKPSLVLIDGRFRVCCFLSSVKYAAEGTKIIFDDYILRPHYHFVEKYVKRADVFGRQCLFVVPSKKEIDLNELEKDISNFRFVMD